MANPFVGIGGFFGRFFGNTIAESAAYGIGGALTEPLKPPLQELANLTWESFAKANVGKPLDPAAAAAVVAEDVEAHDWGLQQANYGGYTDTQFEALLGEAENAPDVSVLFELWRRGLIGDAGFTHGLRKAKLEGRWDGPLEGLHDTLLSSEELAMMQQQGFIGSGRANSEGALQGVTEERQQLRFEASGLPPGVETALQMLRRGIIAPAEFAQIVREGHTKTKYTDELLQLEAQVLSAQTYAGLHLRGWIDEAAMVAGGKLTGYDQAQMDLLYKEHGRPATGHQVFIGLLRGGVYNGPTTGIDQAYIDAIRQSNIRPEWTNLLWHGRYLYPPLFQLTRLVQANVIDADTAAEWAKLNGEAPEVVTALHAYWSGGTTAKADPYVKKAETQLWTRTHSAYVSHRIDDAAAGAALATLGLDAAAQASVLSLWQQERALVRAELSANQIKKAWVEQVVNPATGQAWTRADALAALTDLGYDQADSETFLEE